MDIQHLRTQVPAPDYQHVRQLREFAVYFNAEYRLIYHPCCGMDTSPSDVFKAPGTRIVYVDMHQLIVDALKNAGFEAYAANVNEQCKLPESADLAILFNALPNIDAIASTIRPGGYLVCNNHYGAAHKVLEESDLVHEGAIDLRTQSSLRIGGSTQAAGRYIVQRRPSLLKEYWQEVENDDQLIERDPTGMLREAVRTYAGSLDGSFVARYKQLYERAKVQTARRYGPDLYKGYALADVRNDQSFLSPLPALRGNEWTAHVFRKPDSFAPSSSRLKSAAV